MVRLNGERLRGGSIRGSTQFFGTYQQRAGRTIHFTSTLTNFYESSDDFSKF